MSNNAAKYALVALSLMGSAILLFSCSEPDAEEDSAAEEAMMTEYSENLSIVESFNGRLKYHFITPLVEGYTLAREPYREFRKGIRMTTYKNDSLSTVDAVLTANYAIYYEKRQLWEAKGNVVVEKSDGKTLYTQQLFWNALTKKIYSNVDSKIVQNQGRDVFIGEGFESDEEFKDWRFRRMKGRMEVDVAPTDRSDSVGGKREKSAPQTRPAAQQSTPGSSPQAAPKSVPRSAAARPASAPQAVPADASAVRRSSGSRTDISPQKSAVPAEMQIKESPAREMLIDEKPALEMQSSMSAEIETPESRR